MIREHDRVVLRVALSDYGLEPGDVGVVVHIYPRQEAYEVEFITLAGQTAAIVTASANQIRPIGGTGGLQARYLTVDCGIGALMLSELSARRRRGARIINATGHPCIRRGSFRFAGILPRPPAQDQLRSVGKLGWYPRPPYRPPAEPEAHFYRSGISRP